MFNDGFVSQICTCGPTLMQRRRMNANRHWCHVRIRSWGVLVDANILLQRLRCRLWVWRSENLMKWNGAGLKFSSPQKTQILCCKWWNETSWFKIHWKCWIWLGIYHGITNFEENEMTRRRGDSQNARFFQAHCDLEVESNWCWAVVWSFLHMEVKYHQINKWFILEFEWAFNWYQIGW
jgi:hypothetical protein